MLFRLIGFRLVAVYKTTQITHFPPEDCYLKAEVVYSTVNLLRIGLPRIRRL